MSADFHALSAGWLSLRRGSATRLKRFGGRGSCFRINRHLRINVWWGNSRLRIGRGVRASFNSRIDVRRRYGGRARLGRTLRRRLWSWSGACLGNLDRRQNVSRGCRRLHEESRHSCHKQEFPIHFYAFLPGRQSDDYCSSTDCLDMTRPHGASRMLAPKTLFDTLHIFSGNVKRLPSATSRT